MTQTTTYPEPFGIATIASDLAAAREFYTSLYPYPASAEFQFAGIPFFSILKDGGALVTVFQRMEGNPIHGTVPVLRVPAVGEYLRVLHGLGATVIIPESVCPCSLQTFALCADREGNQFIIIEPEKR